MRALPDLTNPRAAIDLAAALLLLAALPLVVLFVISIRHENPVAVRTVLGAGATGAVAALVLLFRLRPRVTARAGARPAPRADGRSGNRIEAFGRVRVDLDARTVRRAGKPVELTPREYELLVALLERRGEACSRLTLLRDVWGHIGAVTTRTVDVHVSALRRKLEAEPSAPRHIHTVSGFGYRLDP